jgi:transcriptional regulator with XRE-family HTH domain
MGTQKEGEARQTAIGTIFSAMLQRKSREFPSVEEFLKTIGMSFATYSQLLRGLGNPTAHTITRTGEALGLSGWEMLGLDEKIVRGWLAGQDIDLSQVNALVTHQRASTLRVDADKFSLQSLEPKAPEAATPAPVAKKEEPKNDVPKKAAPAPKAPAKTKKTAGATAGKKR